MHIVLIVLLFSIFYLSGGNKSDINQKIRLQQVTLMGLCLFLFAALRSYNVGIDVELYYYDMYNQEGGGNLGETVDSYILRDPGFFSFIWFLHLLSDDPQIMLAAVGALVAFAFSYFAYHEKGNILLIFLMFIGFRVFSFTLSGLRQAMAMSFIFIAFIQLKKGRTLPYFLLTSLAATFHLSSLVFLLAYPAMKIKKTNLLITSVFGAGILNIITGGVIANYFALLFFRDRFDGYIARSANMAFEGSYTLLIYLVVYVVSLLYFQTMTKKDNGVYRDYNVLTFGILFAILGQSMDNVFRIAYYFIYPLYPLTGQVIKVMFNDKTTASIVCFLFAVFLATQYLYLGTGAGTENYSFFWQVH